MLVDVTWAMIYSVQLAGEWRQLVGHSFLDFIHITTSYQSMELSMIKGNRKPRVAASCLFQMSVTSSCNCYNAGGHGPTKCRISNSHSKIIFCGEYDELLCLPAPTF